MKYSWMLGVLLVLLVAAPFRAVPAGIEPADMAVIDVANDDGTAIGALWDWVEAPPPEARLAFEVRIPQELIDHYALTDAQQQTLDEARAKLEEELAPLLPQREAAMAEASAAQDEFKVAEANRADNTATLRREYYKKQNAADAIAEKIDKAKERFNSRIKSGHTTLLDKSRIHQYLETSSSKLGWLATDAVMPVSGAGTVADAPNRFGNRPKDPEKLYVEINSVKPAHPELLNGAFADAAAAEMSSIDEQLNDVLTVDLMPGMEYQVRMVIVGGLGADAELRPIDLYREENLSELGGTINGEFEMGNVEPAVNYFDVSKFNNLVFAVVFTAIILTGIMVARRNPNIFIRRIQGLEAVDEAIGRATEMGKPVLYLCGLDPLSTLPTIAAVNILGRVARRIADYDSDLVVPCRDPVVLTVAQEVAKEAYIDAGRPDAYREDNIYFVTDDQFSYTATTCAIMMREKPAANFFMGYYYAESLLLAETGATTGAIQIAGTDALAQLPFFITTCDYTLIGEELYAASAYLSREPMLLGSLKGQDISKAVFMVIIVVQTVLFILNANWDWLRTLVRPL